VKFEYKHRTIFNFNQLMKNNAVVIYKQFSYIFKQ